ncbi:hypothetical protein WJX84_011366 [Apatococcus fuscideae]|uniref:Uncharacterized protein n=1 Tax=Apatococcus fuscideae TaxID=2026836 RepID=A0AAW1SWY1_9CHLO
MAGTLLAWSSLAGSNALGHRGDVVVANQGARLFSNQGNLPLAAERRGRRQLRTPRPADSQSGHIPPGRAVVPSLTTPGELLSGAMRVAMCPTTRGQRNLPGLQHAAYSEGSLGQVPTPGGPSSRLGRGPDGRTFQVLDRGQGRAHPSTASISTLVGYRHDSNAFQPPGIGPCPARPRAWGSPI